MLKSIRDHRNKFLGIFVAGVCAFLMLGFGVDAFLGARASGPIARVNDHEISYNQFSRRYDQIRQHFQSQFGENFHLIEPQLNIRQQAIDSLISDNLLESFSKDMGLAASTAQVESRLLANPYFQGQFSQRAYKDYLRAVGMTGGQLERAMKKEVLSAQISGLFTDAAHPTDRELRSMYDNLNAKITLSYVAIDPKDFESKVDKSDEEQIKKYFDNSKNRYVLPRKVQLSYVAFRPADFYDEVQVDEAELKDLLSLNEDEFSKPRRVRLKQIFFPTDSGIENDSAIPFLNDTTEREEAQQQTADELVRLRAEEALKRLEEGEEFESVAKEMSEDSATKDSGGDMGFMTFDELAPEIARTADTLDVGEYSRVIKTAKGYNLILLDDYEAKKPMSFEEAKPKLIEKLRKQDAPLYAFESAQAEYDAWEESDKPLKEYAAEKSLRVVSSDGAVTFGEQTDTIPGKLLRDALKLDAGERDVIEIDEITYLLEVEDVVESTVPDLDQVRERVVSDFVKQQSKDMARKLASEILASLGAGSDWDPSSEVQHKSLTAAASAKGVETKTSPEASRKDPSKIDFMSSPQIQAEAFALREDAPLAPQVFEFQGKFYLISLASRELPKEEPPESELSKLREEAMRDGGVRLLESLISTLKAEADIWVDTDLLLNQS